MKKQDQTRIDKESKSSGFSFYETGAESAGRQPEFTDRPLRSPFVRPTRNPRTNAVLAAATLIAAGVAGWMLFAHKQSPSLTEEAVPSAGRRIDFQLSSPPLSIALSPTAEVLADELADLPLSPPPTSGAAPLDINWIKQAAYHVVMGQKAYAEESLPEALRHFEACLKIYPNLKGVHRYLGMINLLLKNYDRAAEEFARVAEEEGISAGVANNLGITYLALNIYDEAEKYLKQAIQLDPEYANAYLNLYRLAQRRNQPEAAAGYLEEYLQLRPDDLAAMQAYASVLMQLKRWSEAVSWLERLSNASPELAPVYFQLAVALAHIGHKKAAFSAIARGIELADPQQALAWLAQADFDPLRREERFREIVATLSAHSQ